MNNPTNYPEQDDEIRRILQVYRGWVSDADAQKELPEAIKSLRALMIRERESVLGDCLKLIDKHHKRKFDFPHTSVPSMNWIAGRVLDDLKKELEHLSVSAGKQS